MLDRTYQTHWLVAIEYAKIAGEVPEMCRAEVEYRAWARQVLEEMNGC